jgi:hypothetical protein
MPRRFGLHFALPQALSAAESVGSGRHLVDMALDDGAVTGRGGLLESLRALTHP